MATRQGPVGMVLSDPSKYLATLLATLSIITRGANNCEAAIHAAKNSNRNSCGDSTDDGDTNGNDGAPAAGVNMMPNFLVLIMLVVMATRMLMVTTMAMAGLMQPV